MTKISIALLLVFLIPVLAHAQTSEVYFEKGVAKGDKGDWESAEKDYSKAIKLDPEYAIAYYDRGIDKSELGDYKGAILDFNKAIDLDPHYAAAYYKRGVVKIELGQTDTGCLDLTKSGDLGYFQSYDAIKKYCNQ